MVAHAVSALPADGSAVEPQVVPSDIVGACDTVRAAAESGLHVAVKRADGSFTDSFEGKTQRIGCRLTATLTVDATPNQPDVMSIVVGSLEQHGWAQDLRYMADGPDGSDLGIRRRDALCLLMVHGPGHDDDDTTSVRPPGADSVDFTAECRHDDATNAGGDVPDSLWSVARERGLDSLYAIDYRLQSPPYVNGDFDGDGVTDAAVLVSDRKTGKLGVAFVLRGPTQRRVVVVGAGNALQQGRDDFSGMTRFGRFQRGVMMDTSIPSVPSQPFLADAVYAAFRDSTDGFITWTGSGYRWSPGSPRPGVRKPE